MATNFYLGTAAAVRQSSSITVTANDAATSYILTFPLQLYKLEVQGNAGGANATAQDIATAWNASQHPYTSGIVATPTGARVDFLRDAARAGEPFEFTSSVSGGTGTISPVTVDTANAGPNDWSTPDNWSLGNIPVNGDDVIIADIATPIVWGLNQSAVSLASLRVDRTYTGVIGLPYDRFAEAPDASSFSTERKNEYRDTYLKIGATRIDLGQNFGPAVAAGSGRIKIDNNLGGASTLTVHGTAANAAEFGKSAVRYLASNAGADIFVREAAAGVGVATDAPGETSTIGKLSVRNDTIATALVETGPGVTLGSVESRGGTNVIQAAATIPQADVYGGLCSFEGDFAITLLNVYGGIARPNNVNTSGSEVATANVDGGELDGAAITNARTFDTVNLVGSRGGTFNGNSALTVTNLNAPPTQDYSLRIAPL